MTAIDNKAIVKLYFEELDAGNAEAARDLFSEDCRIYRPEQMAPLIGADAIHNIVLGTRKLYTEFRTKVHDMIQEGDRVAIRLTHRAVCRGHWNTRIGSFDCSGKPITWDAIVIFVLANGRITEEYVMRDELSMLLNVGAIKRAP
jgi:ketosteroid isomerase-like protein